ncbi:hypothetical protein SYK_06540 [Pseudodesulfovibrio nedwellii]|uniref:DdrB-like domain-containing protein n=1 Tax=Pseudodesulfovibrio nedwellii TaxID=2973072 RepID=A0ABM8AY81_9BACT|nr:PLxRFG domain-containing protein [Pseudodesulfovibrio nedwellii]BDQ36294.1 hypothetical protein SYK_06540 [Pseudodesulfovibrio nedwellii]
MGFYDRDTLFQMAQEELANEGFFHNDTPQGELSTDDQKLQAAVDQYNQVNPNTPITVDDLPDNSGFFGGARELGTGILNAVRDQFPEDIARISRGGDVDLKNDSWEDEWIAEQKKDRASRIPSKQVILGDKWNESLAQGPASVATSAVVGASGGLAGAKVGAMIGGAAGSAVPVAGTTAGAITGGTVGSMVGAFASTGPAFYRMAKDQFLEEMLDVAKKGNVNLTAPEWEAIKKDIDDEASEMGAWEAGPEAISQALTAGMFKGVGGKIFGKIPGFAGITEAISKRALARIGAKMTAEVAEEEVTEAVTYFGQEGIRKDMDLRKDDPTLGEFIDTQAGPVAVGSVLQMGVHKAGAKAYDLMKGEEEQPSYIDARPVPGGLPQAVKSMGGVFDDEGYGPRLDPSKFPTVYDDSGYTEKEVRERTATPFPETVDLMNMGTPQVTSTQPNQDIPAAQNEQPVYENALGYSAKEVSDYFDKGLQDALNAGSPFPTADEAFGLADPHVTPQMPPAARNELPVGGAMALPPGGPVIIPQPTQQTGYGPIPQEQGRTAMAMPQGQPPAALPEGSRPIAMGWAQSEPIPSRSSQDFEMVSNEGENYRPDFEIVHGGVPAVRTAMDLAPAQAQPLIINKANEAATSPINAITIYDLNGGEHQGVVEAESDDTLRVVLEDGHVELINKEDGNGDSGYSLKGKKERYSFDYTLASAGYEIQGQKVGELSDEALEELRGKMEADEDRAALGVAEGAGVAYQTDLRAVITEQARRQSVETKANEAATSEQNDTPQPTEAQIEKGNYKLGHVKAIGLDISIENPAGSERSGTDKDGKPWSVQMQHHYGYIKGTVGKDKDHLDVFLKDGVESEDMSSKPVFVVDQKNEDGSFDEHKILMGFDNAQEAQEGYLSNYEAGWTGLGNLVEMSADEFKAWTKGNTTKPVGTKGHVGKISLDQKNPEQSAPDGVNVMSSGKPYSKKGIRLVVAQKVKKGMNVEEVQLDDEGKQWGWREVVDEGPVMDQDAQATIKDKLLKAVPNRDYDAMMEHGWSEQLPEGSFKSSERPTGVATRMVVIEKPDVSGSAQSESDVKSEAVDIKEQSNGREESDTVSEGRAGNDGSGRDRGRRSSSVHESNEASRTSREYGKVSEKDARGNRTGIPYRVGEETKEDDARYEIRELSDVVPSHDPTDSFKPREDYPPKVQERVYHSDKEEQAKVKGNAARFNPAYLVTNNPDASNGAPIITEKGLVLGGNGRTMTLQVVYESYPQHAEKYVSELKDSASIFGLTAEDVDGFEQPVLVRVVDMEGASPKELLKKSRIYNQNVTGGMGKMAQSVSLGNLISEDTLKELALDLSRYGDMTFSEYLSQNASRRIVKMLEENGVLDTTKRNEYWDDHYNVLNPDGKATVINAFRGLVFANPNTLERAPKRIVNKMDRILPALARLSRNKNYDMSGLLQDVLDMFIEAEQAKRTNSAIKTVHDYLTKYMSMAPAKGKGDPVAEDWMRIMDKTPAKHIAEQLHQYADSMPKQAEGSHDDGRDLPGIGLENIKEQAKANELEKRSQAFKEATEELVDEAKGKKKPTSQNITMFSRKDVPTRSMSRKVVEGALNKLQKSAEKALPLEVVQSVEDLPKHIQDEFNEQGGGVLEAANDGDRVYLVAGNIGSNRRAVALWMHEQGLHQGLKGLFGPREYVRMMNRVFVAAGGKRAFRDTASLYDFDLNNRQDQILAAEEYLAGIAEKVRLNKPLSNKAKKIWRRFVKAVTEWLRDLGLNMNLTDAEIALIVDDAVQWTIHGPDGPRGGIKFGQREPSVAFSKESGNDKTRFSKKNKFDFPAINGQEVSMVKDSVLVDSLGFHAPDGNISPSGFGRVLFPSDREISQVTSGYYVKAMGLKESPQFKVQGLRKGKDSKGISVIFFEGTHEEYKESVANAYNQALMWAKKNGFEIEKESKSLGSGVPEAKIIHKATAIADQLAKESHDKKWGEAEDVFVRYGDIPEGGISFNYRDNISEEGVSVYHGKYLPKSGEAIAIPKYNQEMGTFLELKAGERPLYVVDGEKIGTGSDGEPVLKNAKIRVRIGNKKVKFSRGTYRQSALIQQLQRMNGGTMPSGGNAAVRAMTAKPSQIAKDAAKKGKSGLHNRINTGDLSVLQEVASLPHWIAKRFPAFDAIYRRQLTRMDERAAVLKESLEEVEDFFTDLSKEDHAALRDMIWEIDGEKLPGMNLDKFIPVQDAKGRDTYENGRIVLEMNPRYYRMFERWLDKQPVSEKVKKAMSALRESLDRDFLRAYDAMREMAEIDEDTIKAFRSNINHVHNYFPHKRYGGYYVQAVGDNYVGQTDEGKWAVFNATDDIVSKEFANEATARKHWTKNKRSAVHREHFDASTKGLAGRKAEKKMAELKADYPDNVDWSTGKNERLPDELYEFGIDTNAMEQIVVAAADKIENKEMAKEIKGKLAEAVSDTMKSRGWSAATIGRKGVPGHEKEDIQGIIYDYKAGLSGWLTKIQASRDFTSLLGQVDAKHHPKEYVYATNYVQNMLRNADKIDRAVGNIKAMAFLWYLGFNLKTAALNLTQNVIVGIPRFSMDVKSGGFKYWKAAAATLTEQLTGRATGGKVKTLPKDESRLLDDLYREDVITEGFLNEIRGRVQGVSVAAIGNKVLKWAGMPMAIAERFNRASLALAAYRAARDGKITNEAVLAELGAKPGVRLPYEKAKAYAEDVVRDSHFVYGKTNLPQPLRNSTIGRGANPAYTFRTFSHNILSIWNWMLTEQGAEGKKAFAKSMMGTMAIGGFTALPFYATLMHLFQWATGDDDDWTEEIRKKLPEGDILRDMVSYGLPAGAGFSLGGSVGLETPILSRVEPGATIEESVADNLGDIFGIPYDMFIRKPSRIVKALNAGNEWRAFEEAAPTIVRNGMAGYRLWKDGQRSISGKPINEPGKRGPRKLTEAEAIGKMAGFQPISSRKSWDQYRGRKVSQQVRSNKATEFANNYVGALRAGDEKKARSILTEWKGWNKEAMEDKKPWMVITTRDMTSRIKSRSKGSGVSPREALRILEQRKAY